MLGHRGSFTFALEVENSLRHYAIRFLKEEFSCRTAITCVSERTSRASDIPASRSEAFEDNRRPWDPLSRLRYFVVSFGPSGQLPDCDHFLPHPPNSLFTNRTLIPCYVIKAIENVAEYTVIEYVKSIPASHSGGIRFYSQSKIWLSWPGVFVGFFSLPENCCESTLEFATTAFFQILSRRGSDCELDLFDTYRS